MNFGIGVVSLIPTVEVLAAVLIVALMVAVAWGAGEEID